MKVRLVNNIEKATNIIFTACRTCYSSKGPLELIEQEPDIELIKKIVRSGHLSTLEHVVCTFAIEGVSRSLLIQLTRHRLASYSVQSQRYCKFNNFFVLPDKMRDKKVYDFLESCKSLYNELISKGIDKEDARAILPNASSTNIFMTCNLRELIHICHVRLCKRSQAEIRELVGLMRDEVVREVPFMQEFLVPKCKICTEKDNCK